MQLETTFALVPAGTIQLERKLALTPTLPQERGNYL